MLGGTGSESHSWKRRHLNRGQAGLISSCSLCPTPRASSAVRRHCRSRRCLERPQERNLRPGNGPGLAQEGHRGWSSGPAASKAHMEGGGRPRGDSRSLVWVAGVEPALASGGGRTRCEKMLHLVCPLPALSSP